MNNRAIYESCIYVKSYTAAHEQDTLPYSGATDLQYRALTTLPEEWHATIRAICTDETLYKSLYLHKINTLVLSSNTRDSPNCRVWVFKRARHPREEFNKWNRQSLCLSLSDIQRYDRIDYTDHLEPLDPLNPLVIIIFLSIVYILFFN